jgi:hypothetical protein
MIDPSVVTAYQQIAQMMHEAAPGPYARLVAALRYHGSSSQADFQLVDDGGKRKPFELRDKMAHFRLLDALKQIDSGLQTGKGPGFSRADFELTPDGKFDFRVHNEALLARSLADAIRAQWPADAQRLRLSATFDSFGRFQHRYEQIDADGRAHYVDWPMPPTGDFDDVTRVLADLWESRGEKFRELALELGQSGDDHPLLLDGREP